MDGWVDARMNRCSADGCAGFADEADWTGELKMGLESEQTRCHKILEEDWAGEMNVWLGSGPTRRHKILESKTWNCVQACQLPLSLI